MQTSQNRLTDAIGALIDEVLSCIDEIASKPVPYSLTPAAEALLSDAGTERTGS